MEPLESIYLSLFLDPLKAAAKRRRTIVDEIAEALKPVESYRGGLGGTPLSLEGDMPSSSSSSVGAGHSENAATSSSTVNTSSFDESTVNGQLSTVNGLSSSKPQTDGAPVAFLDATTREDVEMSPEAEGVDSLSSPSPSTSVVHVNIDNNDTSKSRGRNSAKVRNNGNNGNKGIGKRGGKEDSRGDALHPLGGGGGGEEREVGSSETTATALAVIRTAKAHVSELKRKLEDVGAEERRGARSCVPLLDYLAHVGSLPKTGGVIPWMQGKLNRLLFDFFVQSGYFRTAERLAESASVGGGATELRDAYLEARHVQTALLVHHDCVPALEWCARNRSRLQRQRSMLEFRIHLQQFVELVRQAKFADALGYSRAYLSAFRSQPHLMPEMQKVLALLIFAKRPPETVTLTPPPTPSDDVLNSDGDGEGALSSSPEFGTGRGACEASPLPTSSRLSTPLDSKALSFRPSVIGSSSLDKHDGGPFAAPAVLTSVTTTASARTSTKEGGGDGDGGDNKGDGSTVTEKKIETGEDKCNPYAGFLDLGRWQVLADLFLTDFTVLNSQLPVPLLVVYLQCGLAALNCDPPPPQPASLTTAASAAGNNRASLRPPLPSSSSSVGALPGRDPATVPSPLPGAALGEGGSREGLSSGMGSRVGRGGGGGGGMYGRGAPMSQPEFRALCRGLPCAMHTHSKLVCPVTNELMDDRNPPYALPNGYVYGQRGVEILRSRGPPGHVICPETGESFPGESLKRVFIM